MESKGVTRPRPAPVAMGEARRVEEIPWERGSSCAGARREPRFETASLARAELEGADAGLALSALNVARHEARASGEHLALLALRSRSASTRDSVDGSDVAADPNSTGEGQTARRAARSRPGNTAATRRRARAIRRRMAVAARSEGDFLGVVMLDPLQVRATEVRESAGGSAPDANACAKPAVATLRVWLPTACVRGQIAPHDIASHASPGRRSMLAACPGETLRRPAAIERPWIPDSRAEAA